MKLKTKKPRLKVYTQLWAGPHYWIKLEDGTRIKFDHSSDAREYAQENGYSKRLRIVPGKWPGKLEKGHTVDASFWDGPLPNRGKDAYVEAIKRTQWYKQQQAKKETGNGQSTDSTGRGGGDSGVDGHVRKQRRGKRAGGQSAESVGEGEG